MKISIDNRRLFIAIFQAVAFFVTANSICAQSLNHQQYLELADSAENYISQGLWNKAEQSLLQALRLEPANFKNYMLLSNLGIVRINKEEYDKAIEAFSLGLEIAPSSSFILNNRARTYLLIDKIDEAISDLDKSLAVDSIQEWPLQTRALLYASYNENEKAEELFTKLKKAFPENAISYSGLAALSIRKGKVDDALKLYQVALEKNPQDEETLCSYIYLQIETGKYSEARSLLRESINKFPENPMLYLLRGYLHKLNYRNEEAFADKKTAIAKGIDPSYASSLIP